MQAERRSERVLRPGRAVETFCVEGESERKTVARDVFGESSGGGCRKVGPSCGFLELSSL